MSDTSPQPFWFTEKELPYGKQGLRLSTEVSSVLHREDSPFGAIEIFDTPFYGKMLVLDGIIQTTTYDEFIYHEMMVIAPTLYHSNPRSILIIGGGDGGAIKQALRIKGIERIVLVEIDTKVIDLCKKFLPEISDGAFENEKVELVVADGAEYLSKTKDAFDIIVMDLTDPLPDSPAEALFSENFYAKAKSALTPHGVIAVQCGSLLFQPEEVKNTEENLRSSFKNTFLHNAVVPGYQLTSFGFIMATDSDMPTSDEIVERLRNIAGEPKFLSREMFYASKAVPPYLRSEIEASRKESK